MRTCQELSFGVRLYATHPVASPKYLSRERTNHHEPVTPKVAIFLVAHGAHRLVRVSSSFHLRLLRSRQGFSSDGRYERSALQEAAEQVWIWNVQSFSKTVFEAMPSEIWALKDSVQCKVSRLCFQPIVFVMEYFFLEFEFLAPVAAFFMHSW